MLSIKATQADGFYYAPDFDVKKHKGVDKYRKIKHKKEGGKPVSHNEPILPTIRFEMPFKVWCLSCNSTIDKGVRFNAQKSNVGQLHSTKIWEFAMRCPSCKSHLRIRTDPEKAAYDCVEGLRKHVDTFQADSIGVPVFRSPEERERAAIDPMYEAEIRATERAQQLDTENDFEMLKERSLKTADVIDRHRRLKKFVQDRERVPDKDPVDISKSVVKIRKDPPQHLAPARSIFNSVNTKRHVHKSVK